MATKILFNAIATLPSGEYVEGPMFKSSTETEETYIFINKTSSLDFYIQITKGEDGWHKSGGQNLDVDQFTVSVLGLQVDTFLKRSS